MRVSDGVQIWIGVDDQLPRRIRAVYAADPLQLRNIATAHVVEERLYLVAGWKWVVALDNRKRLLDERLEIAAVSVLTHLQRLGINRG